MTWVADIEGGGTINEIWNVFLAQVTAKIAVSIWSKLPWKCLRAHLVNVFLWVCISVLFFFPPPALLLPHFSFWEVIGIRGTDHHPPLRWLPTTEKILMVQWNARADARSHIRGSATEVEGPRCVTGLTTEERVKFEETGRKPPPSPPNAELNRTLKKTWPRGNCVTSPFSFLFFVVVELLERICPLA